MKGKIIFCSCLVLVCISVVASEQTDDHHNEDSTSMKTRDAKVADSHEDISGKNKAIPPENQRVNHAPELNIRDVSTSDYNKERGMDSSYGSGSFEEDNLKDRGLFDFFIGDQGKRGKRQGRYPPSQFRGGYGGRGPSPFRRQSYRGQQSYGNFGGYGNQGPYRYGGQYPGRGQYPGAADRYGQFSGRRGRRFGSGNFNYNGNYNSGYPEEGYYGQSSYGSYSPYRDIPTRSNIPVEPVLAR